MPATGPTQAGKTETGPVTGRDVRLAARANKFTGTTSGLAPTYLQANLLVLPSRHAADFRLLCARNPVPCPLIGESSAPGAWDAVNSHIANLPSALLVSDVDVRRDAPRYNVYRDATLLARGALDIVAEWTPDHVAFLIGCSFSFEAALAAVGLRPRHTALGRIVPMYRTRVPLCPAGVFVGATYVVSMRPYAARDVERVRAVTRAYGATHGEPLAWGWESLERLGIADVDVPQWGDSPLTADGRPLGEAFRWKGEGDGEGEVPVFWGCGVTPQEVVVRAGLDGTVMAHAPGHMLVLDCRDEDITSG